MQVMLKTIICLAVMLMAFGCQGSTPRSEAELRAAVGRRVHLVGTYRGPGKIADYVVVAGETIYLFDPDVSGGMVPEYGSSVAVDGVLDYQTYPNPPTTAPITTRLIARPYDHYLMNHPHMRVIAGPRQRS